MKLIDEKGDRAVDYFDALRHAYPMWLLDVDEPLLKKMDSVITVRKAQFEMIQTRRRENRAKEVIDRIIRSTIRQIMSHPCFSGDDSILKNAWDDFCAQVQIQESFMWDEYVTFVEGSIYQSLQRIFSRDRAYVWLETSEGMDWMLETESITDSEIPFNDDDIVSYIKNDHLMEKAGNWSNKRLRQYHEKSYLD